MKIIIVAPHADDEMLGCGGMILKRKHEGAEIAWLLMSSLREDYGWSSSEIQKKEIEIENTRINLGINSDNFFRLNLPPAKIDTVPISIIIEKISKVFNSFKPNEVFLPHPSDIHSDHRITFEAASSCTKWFRYPFIKKIFTYETLSETEFALDPRYASFRPNTYIDISVFLKEKIDIINNYKSEIKEHPFPRNNKTIESKAFIRGSEIGCEAAEAFCLLKSIEK